jgi:DNA-directed RNA polymerase specialized sigma24 family protein
MNSPNATKFQELFLPHVTGLFQTALHVVQSNRDAERVVCNACAGLSAVLGNEIGDLRVELFRFLFQEIRRSKQRFRQRASNRNVGVEDPVLVALWNLPAACREMLLLVDCQGFSYSEAAEILGVSPTTIASGIGQGRERLQQELSGGHSMVAR